MTTFGTIKLQLSTTKPQVTDEQCEARANECDMIRDKIADFFEQVSGFIPAGWTVEVAE